MKYNAKEINVPGSKRFPFTLYKLQLKTFPIRYQELRQKYTLVLNIHNKDGIIP
jgi:hypothetical protein